MKADFKQEHKNSKIIHTQYRTPLPKHSISSFPQKWDDEFLKTSLDFPQHQEVENVYDLYEYNASIFGASPLDSISSEPEPQDLRSDSFWLRSEDIQGVSEALLAQKQIKPQNFNFLPSINAQLKPHELGSVEQAIEQNLADNIPYLAMAINITPEAGMQGNHWIYYCHLRTSEGVKAYLLNSMGEGNSYTKITQNLALRINEHIPANLECRNIGCQHDSNNCGMWVLEFLKQTIELVPDLNALDVLENPLEQFSEIMNKICLVYAKYINNPAEAAEYIQKQRNEYYQILYPEEDGVNADSIYLTDEYGASSSGVHLLGISEE